MICFPKSLLLVSFVHGVFLSASADAQIGEKKSPSPGKEGETGTAQEKEKQSPPVFYLHDLSKIAGFPQLDALQVDTQYGPLSIPRDQLVRVRFARRLAADLQAKIQELIGDLGDADFDKREAATQALKEIGPPALELLQKAAKSTNEEVKNRSEILVGQLSKPAEGKASEDENLIQLAGSDDEIVTTRMTIKGRIPHEEFIIDSRYGELRVRTSDLTGISFRPTGPSSLKAEVTTQHQPQSNWLDTKFDLTKGQKLKLEASGQVTVRNYGISSGPEGNREWGGTSFGNFPMLSLIGKIGKKGQPFLIGNAFNNKVRSSGRLYLAIVQFSPYPGGAAGGYQVKGQVSGGE
jgi:hypothetical protein